MRNLIALFYLIVFTPLLVNAQHDDYLEQARKFVKQGDNKNAIEYYEKAIHNRELEAFYEYGKHLLSGDLGKKDTLWGFLYMYDISVNNGRGVLYPFCSRNSSNYPIECVNYIYFIHHLDQNKVSDKYRYMILTIEACHKARKNLIECERLLKEAYNESKKADTIYYRMHPALLLAYFYTQVDWANLQYKYDNRSSDAVDSNWYINNKYDYYFNNTSSWRGEVEFESMGRIDSLVLYQYNHHHERSAEDNAVFWFEKFFEDCGYPLHFLPNMTEREYNTYEMYLELCKFGLSATKKGINDDVVQKAVIRKNYVDPYVIDIIYESGDYLNAYRLYYNANYKYGMAKCNYKLHNYNEAFSNLNEVIIECIDDGRRYFLLPERLSLLSSAYRYGRGVKKDEVYADKLLELSKIIEKDYSSNYKLNYKSNAKVITGIKIEYKDGKILFFEK